MERRKTPRTSIPKLAYVNFEPYNTGGVITNLSTAGLRFHTIAPMQQGGVLRLSLTLGTMKQIEAVGELVWTDSSRQIGGVRFVILPPASADQIKEWLLSVGAQGGENDAKSENQLEETITPLSAASSAEVEKLQPSAPAVTGANQEIPKPVLPVIPAPAPPQDASLPNPVGENVRPAWVPPSARPYSAAATIGPHSPEAPRGDVPSANTQPPYGFVPPSTPSHMPWITHFDPDPPEGKSAFARGLIAVVVVCVLLAPVAWIGLHRYGMLSGPLWPVNSVASNPASTPTETASTKPISPAPDAASPPDANSGAPNSAAPNSAAPNPLDAKSATAATPAPAEPSAPSPVPSAVPAPKPAANSVAQSAQAPATTTKEAATPEAATSVPSEPAPAPGAQSRIAANGPRDIAPDSLALASEHVAKAAPPAPAPEPENPGESQLILAWQYLEGQGGKPRDPTAASQLLWSAVQKGNLTAETTLANLYLRGEGVPKSCDQARVLLSAASDKGDAEAKRKLLELDRTGCR